MVAAVQRTGSPKVDLFIDDKLQTNLGGIDDYRPSNLSYSLPTPARRYDIVDGKVVQLGVATQPTAVGREGERERRSTPR